jgi:P-type Cu+ transporter
MKKLNDRMLKEKEEKEEGIQLDSCGCNSCGCSTSLNGGQSVEQELHNNEKEEDEQEEQKGQQQQNKALLLNNPKLLIIIGLALTIPIVVLEISFDSLTTDYVSLALSTPIQILLGRPFYVRFFRALQRRRGFTTDTLVVLSTSVAYAYSIIGMITGQELHFFEASASVLTIFTIGEYLEGRVLRTTSQSLKKLFELKPKTATIVRSDGNEETIDADSIGVRDIVVVKPGEKVASDGIVVEGQSSIDESMISGEPMPVPKGIGDKVIGGTINNNGYLKFRATSVGSDTVLSHIVQTVDRARRSKAPIQRLTDRAVRYFVPIVLAIAVSSSLYWLVVAQQPIAFAVTVFASVLVVSCPCALGIATPMVVSLGIDRAAREGVLIKGGQYLEKLARVETVVFDKTGTLTKGKPEVTDIISCNDGFDEYAILRLASSAEIKSEHPIAHAIVSRATDLRVSPLQVTEFSAISGQGIVANYLEEKIYVGNPQTSDRGIILNNIQSSISKLESEGKSVVAVFVDDKLAGIIAISDTLRENAREVVEEIKHAGKQVILLSGDNERTANAIACKVGIEHVLSQVSPEKKAQEIKKLQEQGRKVAMVGDGINDAPALTQADVGIAMGSGTDVALDAGHIVLTKSNLEGVLTALKLGNYSLKKIKQNLAISFAYNAISISIAAGILYGVTNSLILTPALAAVGWIISDSLVFGNSLLVRK